MRSLRWMGLSPPWPSMLLPRWLLLLHMENQRAGEWQKSTNHSPRRPTHTQEDEKPAISTQKEGRMADEEEDDGCDDGGPPGSAAKPPCRACYNSETPREEWEGTQEDRRPRASGRLSWLPEDGGFGNHGGHHVGIHVGSRPPVLEITWPGKITKISDLTVQFNEYFLSRRDYSQRVLLPRSAVATFSFLLGVPSDADGSPPVRNTLPIWTSKN